VCDVLVQRVEQVAEVLQNRVLHLTHRIHPLGIWHSPRCYDPSAIAIQAFIAASGWTKSTDGTSATPCRSVADVLNRTAVEKTLVNEIRIGGAIVRRRFGRERLRNGRCVTF
jgi:hypothetical protein